ncbi:MAG: replication initiator protein A [Oscillospiraceae bacterium]|nr:replication initiator protein A [Oscillospiraceae bacterium]
MNTKVYKICDIIRFEFFRLPKALFANPRYRAMSSDAKLTYALLFERLSLSMQNGWSNDKVEVFLIYTREDIAEELGVTYKKAMAAFRELIANGLIFEIRCGRGMANKIFITKPDVSSNQAREYIPSRTADSEVLDGAENPGETAVSAGQELPLEQFKNGGFGSSATADSDVQELPIREPNHTDYIQTDFNKTNLNHFSDGQTDARELADILKNCELKLFDEETRFVFTDAIERLWYCEHFKVGGAVLPQANVRERLRRLENSMLSTVRDTLRRNRDKTIHNTTAYIMSAVFNSIAEEYSALLVDPYLNTIRGWTDCT